MKIIIPDTTAILRPFFTQKVRPTLLAARVDEELRAPGALFALHRPIGVTPVTEWGRLECNKAVASTRWG